MVFELQLIEVKFVVKQRNLACTPPPPSLPGDFVTKVKQINSQSDLIWMTSFGGLSYLTISSSVYIILIWDPCIFNVYNLCQTESNYIRG